MKEISGSIVDIITRRIFRGTVFINNGIIERVEPNEEVPDRFILPGFVDAHIHIESSMLVPSAFAPLAVKHGTVATVSDPHEIANVCGMEGVEFMINDGNKVPLKFCFGAPSCVPATAFETAGAELGVQEVSELLARKDIYYLAEMMNWPGVLFDDELVRAKIKAAQKAGKPVDGHAPGLKGEQAGVYARAGISTDHECISKEEALDKLKYGMKILIREGSAAKNYEALHTLFETHASELMLCSDDKHPDDLVLGHINELVKRSLDHGYDIFDVLVAACVHPVQHYKLPVGLLQPGQPADFIVVDNLGDLNVQQTWIDGECVYKDGLVHFESPDSGIINQFHQYHIDAAQLKIFSENTSFPVIEAIDGELITKKVMAELPRKGTEVLADPGKDILKMVVVNRYQKAEPGRAFIKNFGIKNGAIASSVGHDCHNIIAVGDSDEAIAEAVNLIMDARGGMAAVSDTLHKVIPLPVAGIMSNKSGDVIGAEYQQLSEMARQMGSRLKAPFMLISFMALLVIPELKLSDKGLFDGKQFKFVDI